MGRGDDLNIGGDGINGWVDGIKPEIWRVDGIKVDGIGGSMFATLVITITVQSSLISQIKFAGFKYVGGLSK